MKTKVLIIGATSDIGQALSQQLTGPAYQLIWGSREVHRLKPLQAHFKLVHQTRVDLLEVDVCNLATQEQQFQNLANQVDVVICLAGYLGDQTRAEKNWNEAHKIMQTNLIGPMHILNIFSEAFARRQQGTIIGISSVAGERGRQSNYHYGAAKAGFSTYLDGLRNRLYQSKVHVLTVKPGFMATKMTADLKLPKLLTASPKQAADHIFSAWQKKKNTIFILPVWRLIMLAIRNIPEFVFKKMSL